MKNPLHIPHLSNAMKMQIFPRMTIYDPGKVDLAKHHLNQFGLLGQEEPCKPIDFPLPKINGQGLDFELLGYEQLYQAFGKGSFTNGFQIDNILFRTLPTIPKKFSRQYGWTVYNQDGSMLPIEYPDEDVVTFDVEVMYNVSKYPVIATCCSNTRWYSWVSPGLFENRVPSELISLGNPRSRKLIIGHNVSYDRARIKEEYEIEKSKFNFIDTLSLHVSVAGFCNAQRALYLKEKRNLQKFDPSKIPELLYGAELAHEMNFGVGNDADGTSQGSMNSLLDIAKFYLNEDLDKSSRDYFSGTDLSVFQDSNMFQQLMLYCARDVHTTARLYNHLLPEFRAKCPHPASLAGILHISKGYLPTNQGWSDYLSRAESEYQKNQNVIEKELQALSKETLNVSEETKSTDPWLKHLDWEVKETRMTKEKLSAKGTVVPSRPHANQNMALLGTPNWYRGLWDNKLKRIRISLSKKVVPYLLKLEWRKYPIRYHTKFGWIYQTPTNDMESHDSTPLEIEENSSVYSFRIPHPGGAGKNCGNPLSKLFSKCFEDGTISSPIKAAKKLLNLHAMGTYWSSARDRLEMQWIVWRNGIGVIIPNLIPMGTVTRRAVEATWLTAPNAKLTSIGSEVKSKIVAPPGYKIVGADVDSQELWIASLYGDSYFGMHGATAIGFMTLQGTKSKGTDLHSVTGKIVGISRDVAKIFNYSRIYGAGEKYAAELIKKFVPNQTLEQARLKSRELYNRTKGKKKIIRGKERWVGGSESFMFNQLESIATKADCRTPSLDCQIPNTLLPTEKLGRNFLTSRINWVVQSSGVDYLHLLLVSMDYLIRRMGIRGRYMISIHDEIRYLIQEDDIQKACLALQVSNLWIRSYFSLRAGINDLPLVFFDLIRMLLSFQRWM
jgi:DNA polymerase gamma 1